MPIAKPHYMVSGEETLRVLGVKSHEGLHSREVEKRAFEFGFNELIEKKGKSVWAMLREQFESPLILILLVAAGISGFFGIQGKSGEELLDAIAILAIVVLNAVIGVVQESRAEESIKALKKLVAPMARVLRNAREARIPARELVPGDVIVLEAGDKVPADARLLETRDFECEEASFSGESVPVRKDAQAVFAKEALVQERINTVFMGTLAVKGKARAVVTETGMKTEIGKIVEMVEEVEDEQTPLQERLSVLGKQLGLIALGICAIIFVFGVLQGRELVKVFLLAVSLAVAAVPEGLPAIVTLTLAVGVQRMSSKNAIVRSLPSVETLGSTTVICSDKTGTLTRNEMTVKEVFFDSRRIRVSGSGYDLRGKFVELKRGIEGSEGEGVELRSPGSELLDLLKAGVACNASALAIEADGKRASVVGDPTEASLLVLAEKAGIKYEEVRSSSKVEDEIPFDSERKMMSILANGFLYSKGAFEVLSRKCSHVVWNGRVEKFDEEKRKAFERENEEMTGKALRVLALAFKKSGSERISEDNFTLLGLVGMIDPPREEAREAIAQCREAGIKVVMITGDNANTAKAIARELKLLESDSRVVTGAELEEMTEDELAQVVDRVSVFARVNPDHKMKIVNALKTRSHVVAMTGDGVNDAPALKKADIGIAMGITGTDVAKEASKMVLADDNFASIVRAVREGRVIFDNIVKSVKYLLSCNIGEIVAIFVGLILFPASVLLTPIQILWMNLVTDGLPALALGVDNAEPDIMRRKPRKREEDIMDPKALAYLAGIGLELGLITLGVYFLALNQTGLQQLASQGDASARAATMAFSTLVVLQLLHALNVHAGRHSIFSSRVNKFLLVAIGSAFLLQVAITEISFLTGILKTSSLGMREWVVVTAASTLIILTEEVRKLSGRLRGQETV